MKTSHLLSLLGLGLAGCATVAVEPPPPQPTQLVELSSPPPPKKAAKFNARAYVAHVDNPALCEQVARQLHETEPDHGWAALKACVDKGVFTEIRALVAGPWDDELHQRPEAADLLARVIAMRGGDPSTDVQLLHERKIPLFTLAAALAEPALYKGRLIVMRVQVAEVRQGAGASTVRLLERVHQSKQVDAEVGRASATDRFTGTEGTDGSQRTHQRTRRAHTEKRTEDWDTETGREALGTMPTPDPFFSPQSDFVVLARFNGVRASSEQSSEDPDAIAMVSVLTYHAPSGTAVY